MNNICKTLIVLLLLTTTMVANASVATRTLSVAKFTELSLSLHLDVNIKQGPVQEVTATGEDAVLDKLNLKVVNGEWDIKFSENFKGDFKGMVINITVPELSAVNIYGSGSVNAPTLFKVERLELLISGSGSITMNLDAVNIESQIKGSGSINLKGIAVVNTVDISGSGNLNSFELVCVKVVIHTAGSGSGYVHATKSLGATISGSGKIRYRGQPETAISISGSGKVLPDKQE